MKLYKITDGDRSCLKGTGRWRLNRWRGVRGELVPCEHGIHLCREKDLLFWVVLGGTLWRCEHEGELLDVGDKVVVRRARPVERIGVVGARELRLAAVWCVRHTPLSDGRTAWDLLSDERSRHAVEVAEAHALGRATAAELDAARAAAWAAVWAAASRAAVWAAASTGNWAAGWAVARAAAGAAQGRAFVRIVRGEWPVKEESHDE